MISLAIVDDHPVVIEGVQKLFMNDEHIHVMGSFTTGAAFIDYLKAHTVHIVLLDITLPDISGMELCKTIKAMAPSACILAFSNHSDRAVIMQMLQNGASGYLLKNASAEELRNCVYEALDGQITFSSEIKKVLARPAANGLKGIPQLTKREKEILHLIAQGKTNAAIARELSLSTFTVDTHRKNLMQKFEVKNGAALIRLAIEHQLL